MTTWRTVPIPTMAMMVSWSTRRRKHHTEPVRDCLLCMPSVLRPVTDELVLSCLLSRLTVADIVDEKDDGEEKKLVSCREFDEHLRDHPTDTVMLYAETATVRTELVPPPPAAAAASSSSSAAARTRWTVSMPPFLRVCTRWWPDFWRQLLATRTFSKETRGLRMYVVNVASAAACFCF
jgi:hypothetical protein